MEVRSVQDGLLSLCEVQALLQQRVGRRSGPRRYFRRELQNRDEVEMQVQEYLSSSRVGSVSEEACLECCVALQQLQYGLTEAEIIQLLDVAPMHAVEVHLVVEDCAARLDEYQVDQILATVQHYYFGDRGEEVQMDEQQGQAAENGGHQGEEAPAEEAGES